MGRKERKKHSHLGQLGLVCYRLLGISHLGKYQTLLPSRTKKKKRIKSLFKKTKREGMIGYFQNKYDEDKPDSD